MHQVATIAGDRHGFLGGPTVGGKDESKLEKVEYNLFAYPGPRRECM